MINRRNALKSLGAGTGLLMAPDLKSSPLSQKSNFRYSLNTSTISGQKPGLLKQIEITAEAGYDGIELWMRDIKTYLEEGKSLSILQNHINNHGISVESAIGFAPWMAKDKKEAGFSQMEQEMELLAAIGCRRIAAPPAGVEEDPIDLFRVGEAYRELLDLGRKTGVMPQLELWGSHPLFYHLGQTFMVGAIANDPDVRFLPDVYHLFRGGSGFNGLKMLQEDKIEIFHLNDYPGDIPREQQEDKDRVYPGDGIAPLHQILTDLKNMGGTKVLSLELFNREYWQQDALKVAKTGLEKMKRVVREV